MLRNDESLLVRHEAAFALGCVGDGRAVAVLRRAVAGDTSSLVRHEAAMALSEVGSRRDIALLSQGLSDASREVSVSCRVAIERIKERTSRNRLKKGFESRGVSS